MHIRPALPSDRDAIWSIIGPTVRAGETYTLASDMSEAAALEYWQGEDKTSLRGRG